MGLSKLQTIVDHVNERYLQIGGVATLLLGVIIGFFGFPALLNHQIASSLALKKGSEIRDMWSDFPDAIPFKIYLFNITNPMEVQQGKKPVVQEIGPYYFDEHKEKVNMEDDEKEDTVAFDVKDTWTFRKDKSGGLTGEEIITHPNIVLTGMALRTEMEKPAALSLINKGIRQIFGDPTSIFVTAPAMQIMFKGIPFFCNVTEFSAKAICSEMKKQDKEFHKLEDNIYGVSLFGMKNGTKRDRLKVKRGSKDIKHLGKVVEYNGKTKMDIWSGENCNKIIGTDSTIFAPFITEKDDILAFAFDLCRSITARNSGDAVYKGLKGYTYSSGFGDMSTDPELRCFCNTPDTCLKQGMHDLTRCFGIPMAASYPHFYDAHPDYLYGVFGLSPSKDKHDLAMILEPLTGTPMIGYKRLQFSLQLHKIDKIDLMKDIPTVMLPMFWVEEGLDLDDKYLDKLRSAHGAMKAVNIIKWIMIVVGGGLVIAGFVAGRFKKASYETTKINPRYLGIGGLGLFLFGSLFGFLGFPKILHSQIASQLNLKKGGEMRDIWSKIPDPFQFKVYVFNVTNAADVQKGAKPVVIEVGPFFYFLRKEKVNITDHKEDDTVSFSAQDTWYFDIDRSDGLRDDVYVMIPHPALLSIILSTEREKPLALKLINKSFDALFGRITSIFLTTTVKELLFDGIPINCDVKDFVAKGVCTELKKRNQFQRLGENVLGFSFFGMRNATPAGRYRVKRGIKNIKELGQIIQYNGQKKMSIWNGEECNRFMGSDSTIFPPFLGPEDRLGVFSPPICRSIEPYHVDNITYKGLQAYTYTVEFGDMSEDPKLKCFCTSPETCLKKGVHDMTNCVGVPMIASHPHFYLAHPDYQKGVYGMNPVKEKHEMYSVFEPITATPLYAHTRVQLSISIHAIENIDIMTEVPTLIFPIFWVDEGFELNKKLLGKVKVIFAATTAIDIIKWISMVAGLGLGGVSAFLMKKINQGNEINVMPGRISKVITPLEIQSRY